MQTEDDAPMDLVADIVPSIIDTTRVVQRVLETRRRSLAQAWDINAARSLLLSSRRPEASDEDIQLCCESLLLDAVNSVYASKEDADVAIGFHLGAIAEALNQPARLDFVLCHRVGWLRLLELCWLADNDEVAQLLLAGPLSQHALAPVLDQSPQANVTQRFLGPLAHLRVAWRWRVTRRGAIKFEDQPPSEDTPMNSTLRRALFPAVRIEPTAATAVESAKSTV